MSLPLIEHVEKDGFRLRGLEMSRIDGFSDVVFGFALTLLVVSLEVPKTYAELYASLRGFAPFAMCFALLMSIWFAHYRFFRRFGTHDSGTIVINSLLLFVVLFYVYPLKFLFTVADIGLFGGAQMPADGTRQIKYLMLLYGCGFATIYLLLAALYWNGLRQRHVLGLSRLEELLTRSYIVDRVGIAVVGLLSGITAWLLPNGYAGLAGWVYLLIAVVRPVMRRITRRRIDRFHALNKLTASPS
jgi:uncharacterized membrane protein